MPRKVPRVVYRPLGKERAWGQAGFDEHHNPLIEVDPRLGARRQLETLCHECLHLALPELTWNPDGTLNEKGEAEIDRLGKAVSALLWQEGYRKVLLTKHKTPVKISKKNKTRKDDDTPRDNQQ